MKFRPQVQLRFRDEEQFEAVKKAAEGLELSVNEWVVRQVEQGLGVKKGKTK